MQIQIAEEIASAPSISWNSFPRFQADAREPSGREGEGEGREKNVREATVSLCVTLLIAALAAPQLGSLDSVDATGGRACAKSHGITKSFGLNTEKPSLLRRNAVAYLPAGARPRRIFRIASRR